MLESTETKERAVDMLPAHGDTINSMRFLQDAVNRYTINIDTSHQQRSRGVDRASAKTLTHKERSVNEILSVQPFISTAIAWAEFLFSGGGIDYYR